MTRTTWQMARAREMTTLLRDILECPLPVIVAIDGHVRADGFGPVGACDLAVAGPRSTFALTEARIGVAPAIISLTLLPKISSRSAARYYLTGETFDSSHGRGDRIGHYGGRRRGRRGRLTCRRHWPRVTAGASRGVERHSLLPRCSRDSTAMPNGSPRNRPGCSFPTKLAVKACWAFLQKRPPSWATWLTVRAAEPSRRLQFSQSTLTPPCSQMFRSYARV